MVCVCGLKCDCETKCICQESNCTCEKCTEIKGKNCAICGRPPFDSTQTFNDCYFCNGYVSESSLTNSAVKDIGFKDLEVVNTSLKDDIRTVSVSSLQVNDQTQRINPNYENMLVEVSNLLSISKCHVTRNNCVEQQVLPETLSYSTQETEVETQKVELKYGNIQNTLQAEYIRGKYDPPLENYDPNCQQNRESNLSPKSKTSDNSSHEPASSVTCSVHSSKSPSSSDDSESSINVRIRNSAYKPHDKFGSTERFMLTTRPSFQAPFYPLNPNFIVPWNLQTPVKAQMPKESASPQAIPPPFYNIPSTNSSTRPPQSTGSFSNTKKPSLEKRIASLTRNNLKPRLSVEGQQSTKNIGHFRNKLNVKSWVKTVEPINPNSDLDSKFSPPTASKIDRFILDSDSSSEINMNLAKSTVGQEDSVVSSESCVTHSAGCEELRGTKRDRESSSTSSSKDNMLGKPPRKEANMCFNFSDSVFLNGNENQGTMETDIEESIASSNPEKLSCSGGDVPSSHYTADESSAAHRLYDPNQS